MRNHAEIMQALVDGHVLNDASSSSAEYKLINGNFHKRNNHFSKWVPSKICLGVDIDDVGFARSFKKMKMKAVYNYFRKQNKPFIIKVQRPQVVTKARKFIADEYFRCTLVTKVNGYQLYGNMLDGTPFGDLSGTFEEMEVLFPKG